MAGVPSTPLTSANKLNISTRKSYQLQYHESDVAHGHKASVVSKFEALQIIKLSRSYPTRLEMYRT